ncbi:MULTISPECIES: hypothetical protein [unclassified Dysgonomonas]|uniref:hypothetical protein n=1 Tax=unclassified Dysgonomonas TaxID=2630389 RepID=UPI0025BA7793|nr:MULTISPECIES: hypothetical protein [unclassified Dysgonomonas]HMM02042.1 hypothetical protein [Dysgonomonas sp.]
MPTPILYQLFPTLADFRESAPNVESTADFKALNATAISTRKTIVGVISEPIWNKIKSETDTDALMYLRSAWANRTMYAQKIFVAVNNRLEKKGDTYKYELEAMKRQYIDNYHNAMDSLLQILSNDASYDWESSWMGKQMASLKIKSVLDFEEYYHIDTAYLYFTRTVPIQKKELLLTFNSYYDKITDREDLLPNLNTALVYTIIARTLQQFDIIELPPTIRNYFDDNTLSRNGKDERDAVNNMADSFLSDADSLLGNIDLALTDGTTNVDTGTDVNDESNKYYLMG